ncbi:hypothetical protein BJY21_001677 [Kineosphaera limosa]|nr:hypothetical protein [Kineosphaera limosa]
MGWRVIEDQPGWVMVRPEGGGAGLSFQHEPELVPPTWPAQPGQQQVHAHLDIAVADLDHGVAWAVAVGAREADYQPQQNVRVMVDPEGHLFDVFVGPV